MQSERRPAVLIVEDQSLFAMDLQRSLRLWGYDAYAIAASADEAIVCAYEQLPDLVLMDIRIDGPLDGIETAAILRKHLRVPVVYLTAVEDQALLERAKKTEPYGYLVKPVQEGELRRVIGIAFYRSQAERAGESAAARAAHHRIWEQPSRNLKDRFFANISHELRTPLNGLIGFAELLHDGLAGPLTDKQLRFLSYMLTSGRRLLEVINDVLDLARLEAGGVERHPTTVDLATLLAEVVEALQPSLAAKAHRLAIEMDPRCAEVVNDPSVLKQVAHHLLSNAIKFTPRDGAVTLRVTAQIPDRFRIAVTYAGIGVGAPDLERVFIPFEPLDSSAGVSTDTAGVGLALTKRIAEAQAGRVGVDRLPGAGSVFFAELPTTWPAATA